MTQSCREGVTPSTGDISTGVELDDRERALLLAGLFELRITHLEDDVLWAQIAVVAEKLGGDVGAMFFGAVVR
jgi:hypothetical protein